MRLWSLSPKYFDTKGLLAVWREGLLAKHVLEGKTQGYRHHPQLQRFQQQSNPVSAISQYLAAILEESERRGFHFDASKIVQPRRSITISVTRGQIAFEQEHLLRKLNVRDVEAAERFGNVKRVALHPMFVAVSGDVESWEKR
ncbi:MAG: pyrimidine dimer DNA glycosylase/endonuclease V [Thermoguttaceae bacterium]